MVETYLKRLGYWRAPGSSDYPEPGRFVDVNWDMGERAVIWSYLRGGFVVRAYLGPAICRLCEQLVGSLELSDGEFVWPEGLAHYVREHSLKLPQVFIDHVHARLSELERTPVDDNWWRRFANDASE